MILIAHKVNNLKELKKIPSIHGIEIDVRDFNNSLILQHDPFIKGEKIEMILKKFNHKFIIFNIKSERIEFKILNLINKFKIKDYFFLDSSFPMIRLLIKKC